MTAAMQYVNQMIRPRLLIQAAHICAQGYRRDRHLPQLLGVSAPLRHGPALSRLCALEEVLDDQRRRREAGYSPRRHIDILSAVMGEAQLLCASPTDHKDQENASGMEALRDAT